MALGPILAHCSVAAPRLINIEWNLTQDSQSLALGLVLTAAPQLVAPGRSRFRYRRVGISSRTAERQKYMRLGRFAAAHTR